MVKEYVHGFWLNSKISVPLDGISLDAMKGAAPN